MLGSNYKNPQPIFTMKTVPESMKDEFFSQKSSFRYPQGGWVPVGGSKKDGNS
jgi:hypothetical protein